jgi:cytochrome c biogenesis protein CcdA
MDFEKAGKREESVKMIGYLSTIIIFSIMFYFILSFTKKIPDSWNYFNILILVIIIILTSKVLERLLK